MSSTWGPSGTIVCAYDGDTGLVLDITRDGGRTWTTRRPLVGLSDRLYQIALSPGYETDRTIYARYAQTGLFRSTDDGESFLLVDLFGAGGTRPVHMTPLPRFALSTVAGTDDAVVLGREGPTVIANGVRYPVSGAGRQVDLQFLTLAGGSRVVDVSEGVSPDLKRQTTLSLCNAALACADHRAVLPDGYLLMAAAADQTEGGRIVAVAAHGVLGDGGNGLWLSTDAGTTFRRNAAIQPVLDRLHGQYGFMAAVAVVRAGARRAIVLRISSKSDGADYLYRSYDGGASWRQVVPRGLGTRMTFQPWMAATSGGHLLTINGSRRFVCSSDQGATWTPHCR